MKKILLLMLMALPFMFTSCSDDDDDKKEDDPGITSLKNTTWNGNTTHSSQLMLWFISENQCSMFETKNKETIYYEYNYIFKYPEVYLTHKTSGESPNGKNLKCTITKQTMTVVNTDTGETLANVTLKEE